MTFYSNMEDVIKNLGEAGLEQVLFYSGINLELFRQSVSGAYGRVHRDNAGGPVRRISEFVGVIQNDDFFPVNGTHAGGFEFGVLYCKIDCGVRVGDEIHVVSEDERIRNYKVVKKVAIGNTKTVFTKWEVSAIGE